MWGDDYLPGRTPPPEAGPPEAGDAPWIDALLIAIAVALILTCVPGGTP